MNTIDYILQPVSAELSAVEHDLREQLAHIAEDHTQVNPYSRLSDRAVGHLFKAHGKRLRPALFLLSAKAVGNRLDGRTDELIQVATSIELIHSASLIHDDVIDESMFRRGRISVNERYGNKIAVLAGDILYTRFYSIVSSLPGIPRGMRLQLLELFTKVTRRMCFGEIYEERMRNQRKPPEFSDYLDTIANKTASLMSACCEAGALMADADAPTLEVLRMFGYNLGMAYQLLDDLDDHDSVFRDRVRIGEAAGQHVNQTISALDHLEGNACTDRLRAIVDSVNSGRKAETSAQPV